MFRWLLAALLLGMPSFASTMSNFAAQQGGTNLVQLTPGQSPLLTTTFAGTQFQSTFPADLVFQTDIGSIGTFTRTMVGTVAYMSPEHVRGKEVDACTDLSMRAIGFSRN